MFRALLWKEWRELWILPVAAAPLSAIGFFLMQVTLKPSSRDLLAVAFASGLFPVVLLAPAHLFGEDPREITQKFLLARPLDRFRLWWTNFAISLTFLATSGFAAFATILLLAHYRLDIAAYGFAKQASFWGVCTLLIAYCIMCFICSLRFRPVFLILCILYLCIAGLIFGFFALISGVLILVKSFDAFYFSKGRT